MNKMEELKKRLRYCGEDVIIYPWSRIVNPEVIEIGDHSRIDDFTFINGGEGVKIGKYVHIAYFSSIAGGGSFSIGDYSAVCAGVRVLTSSNIYDDAWTMCASAPKSLQRFKTGHIEVGRFAFIGVNSVVFPDVKIGEGAVIGDLSHVNKDVEPWSINVGIPCKKIKDRPKPSYSIPEEYL